MHIIFRGEAKKNCYKRTKFFDATFDSNSSLLNNGEATFHKTSSGYKLSIDLIFSNPCLSLFIHWEMLNDLRGSDYYPINIEFSKYMDHLSLWIKFFRLHGSNTNWNIISSRLNSISNDLYDIVSNPKIDPQVKYASFMSIISGCFRDVGYKVFKIHSDLARSSKSKNQQRIYNQQKYCYSSSKTNSNNHTSCYWWNNECDKLIRIRKAAAAKLII